MFCNAISPYQLHSCFLPNPDHFNSFSKAPSSHNQEQKEISLVLSPISPLVDDGHEHNQTVCVHLSLNYSCPFPSQHKRPFISCCRVNWQTADDCCESVRKYQSPLRLTITVLGGWDIRSAYRKTPPRLLQSTWSAMRISSGVANANVGMDHADRVSLGGINIRYKPIKSHKQKYTIGSSSRVQHPWKWRNCSWDCRWH